MTATTPDPIPRARARARLWLRRGRRSVPVTRVGALSGTYRISTRDGSVLDLNLGEPDEWSSLMRTRGAGTGWTSFDRGPVHIYRWNVEVGRVATVAVPRRESPGYSYTSTEVLRIDARHLRHPACGYPLLRGRCVRCWWLKGSAWAWENHREGRPVWWRKRVYSRVLNPILELLERI